MSSFSRAASPKFSAATAAFSSRRASSRSKTGGDGAERAFCAEEVAGLAAGDALAGFGGGVFCGLTVAARASAVGLGGVFCGFAVADRASAAGLAGAAGLFVVPGFAGEPVLPAGPAAAALAGPGLAGDAF